MKNRHLLIIMFALLAPLAMWGQEELTVYADGTFNNPILPVAGEAISEEGLFQSEFIIPSTELTAINGKNISLMTFYLATPASSSWGSAQFQVFMKEVAATTLEAFSGTDGATIVYTGALDATGSTMEVIFENNYSYGGGNLLIGFYVTTPGTNSEANFVGKLMDVNTAFYGLHDYPEYCSPVPCLPKITFTYSSSAISCYKPRNLNATTEPTTAVLDWNNGHDETSWQLSYSTISGNPEGGTLVSVTSHPHTLSGLTTETTYYAYVRANCGDGYSDWSSVCSFTPSNSLSLTVNEGGLFDGSSYVPINNMFTNEGVSSQYIIPAVELADVMNGQISKLTFYNLSPEISWGDAEFKVYLGEMEPSEFSGTTIKPWAELTEVYSGALSVSNGMMEITLATPYNYGTDNLVVGFNQTTVGTPSGDDVLWYGASTSGSNSALFGFGGSYTSDQSVPKTTILYTQGTPPTCVRPRNLHATVTSQAASLTWEKGLDETSWEISYSTTEGSPSTGTIANVNTQSYTITGLTNGITYYAYVRANCGSSHSDWSTVCAFTPTGVVPTIDLTVNNGTTICPEAPIYSYFTHYGVASQYIIPYVNLSDVAYGQINKLTYYCYSSDVSWGDANFKVYLGEMDDDTFSEAIAWADMTEVYSGSLSVNDGIMEIAFDTPYSYGDGNLVVGFNQTATGTQGSYDYWYGVQAPNSGMAQYGFFGSIDTPASNLPKTTINYTPGTAPSCPKPKNLTVSETDAHSTKLSWTNGGDETLWLLQYATDEDFTQNVVLTSITTNPYVLAGLTSETTYYVHIKAQCSGDDESNWSNVCSFTPSATQKLTINDGTGINYYIPFYYTTNENYVKSQFIIPEDDLTEMIDTKITKLTFYTGSGYPSAPWTNAVFKVYLSITENMEFANTTPIDWTTLTEVYSGNLSANNNRMEITLATPFEYLGGNLLIAFDEITLSAEQTFLNWIGVSTSNYPALSYSTYYYRRQFLPKTTFTYLLTTCSKPVDLTVNSVTVNSATLSWSDGDASAWQVQYKATSASEWSEAISVVGTPSFGFTNLTPATSYDVRIRTVCGADDYSNWSSTTFETACGATIPFTYNFDSDAAGANAAFPQCWTRYNDATNATYQCYPQVYNNTNNAHSTPNTLWFRALADDNYPNTQMAILPEMNADVNTLLLNFWAASSTGGTLKIGVMTDPDDITTYTEVGTVSIASNGATHPTRYSFNLSLYQGNGRYIAIRMDKTTTNTVIFVDDINLTAIVPETIPYTHNFDADITGVYAGAPDGWIFIGNKYPRVYEGNAYSGSNDLMIFHDGNNPNIRQMAVMPEMDYTIQELQIVFWAKTWSKMTSSYLRVGVMTDPNDPTTFTQVESFHVGKDYNEHTVTFENYTGQGKYIAISDWAYNDDNTYFLIDDIIVEPIPSCRKPGQPYVNSYEIQAHQVRMSWQKGTEDQALWQLALGTEADFNPDLVTPHDVDVNNPELFDGDGTWCAYYLTGLNAATTYYVYVRANCGTVDEPDYSDWSALYCGFTTLGCDIPSGLAMASYTSTTAHLWWNSDNGLASEYDLAYSTDEFFNPEYPNDDTHVITGITELGYTIEGLTAETVYYACVRANCGTDGYSDWSETISFMPSAMHTMTLYEQWEISQQAPLPLIYVHYNPDQNQQGIKGQYVLPEIHLSELRFSNIHGISLFTANTSLNFNTNALFDVFVAAVDEPTMNGFMSFDAMTQVYSGTLSIIDGVMTISFTTPFYYSEGNLMIGFKQLTVGDEHNTSVSWKGIDSHVATCYTYDYWFGTEEYGFSPTTCFRYEPCNAPSCPRPRMLKALPMSTFAKLSWSSGNGTCDVQYKKTADAEWTLVEGVSITTYQPYVLRNLAPSTDYVYQVRNVCSDTDYSDWSKSCYFTTRSDEPIVIDVDHPYLEGFDETVFPPTDWVIESANYVSYWKQRETTQEHYLVAYSGYYNDAMMYSPEMHIDAQGAVLTMKHMHNSSLNGTATYCDIMVSTDHGEHFSQLWGGRDATLVGDWITTQISLDDYVNQDIVLEFYHLTYNANHAWDINEIKIKAYNKVFNGSDTDNSWSNPDLWSSNNGELPTADDEVLINSEVTIEYGTVAAAGQIYLNSAENDEEIQGSIVIEDGGQLQVNDTVTVTMQTDVNGYGRSSSNWYLIAPPVQQSMTPSNNHVSGVLEGSYDLYKFDGSYEGAEWRNYKQHQNEFVFQNGQGYLVANSANVHPSFKGTVLPSNQTKTVDLDYAYTTLGGWNLIGNPFTCDAYLADNRSFLRINDDGSKLVAATGVIHPMEGVFVEADGTEQSITFTTTNPSKGRSVEFSLSQNRGAVIDNTVLRFDNSHLLGKLIFGEADSRLYFPQNGKDYAALGAEPVGELPLHFEPIENGTYTINVSTDNLDVNYLHLIDNITGNDVDLLQTPSYTFDARRSDYTSRFKVVFATDGMGHDDNFAFINNGQIIINGDGIVQVIDALGRILFTKEITTANCQLPTANYKPGVYVLRLINGNDVKTQKIVIR